jgi:DNA-binding XRE family transcriptional regulator
MPYPEVPSTPGDHLRNRRHERGLLHKDAADHLGVNTFTLANWEKGYTKPALRFWLKIIEFLGTTQTRSRTRVTWRDASSGLDGGMASRSAGLRSSWA